MKNDWIKRTAGGFSLRIRATPNANKDEILGPQIRDDGLNYLNLKVRANPNENAANEAIIAMLAKAIGVAKSNLEITSGNKNRVKIILVKSSTLSIEAASQTITALGTK